MYVIGKAATERTHNACTVVNTIYVVIVRIQPGIYYVHLLYAPVNTYTYTSCV